MRGDDLAGSHLLAADEHCQFSGVEKTQSEIPVRPR
jgi:hypothetical protein